MTASPQDGNTGGRYRLVTYATQAQQANGIRAMMVLLDPQGNVVDRFMMNSGGEGAGDLATGRNAPLPGLRQTLGGSGAITSYAIEYNSPRTRIRSNGGFTLSDGSTGAMTWGLTIPANAPDGAGRDGFLIHSGGRNVGTHGCFEFTGGSNGRLDSAADRDALRFRRRLEDLQRRGVAPAALELIGSQEGQRYGGATIAPPAPGETDHGQEATQELERRRNFEREAHNAQRPGNRNDPFTAFFLALIRMFLPDWLSDIITASTPDADAPNESREDREEVSNGQRAGYALSMVRADVRGQWELYQRQNAGTRVNHTTPIRQGGSISSDFGERDRPVAGASTDHKGLDITGGGPIHPSAGGVVLFSGRTTGYGYNVIIGHADGTASFYGHMTGRNMPRVGAVVSTDDTIGVMGSTGVSTGVHLHYEQRTFDARGNMTRINPTIDGRTYRDNDHLGTTMDPAVLAQARSAAGAIANQDQGASTIRPFQRVAQTSAAPAGHNRDRV